MAHSRTGSPSTQTSQSDSSTSSSTHDSSTCSSPPSPIVSITITPYATRSCRKQIQLQNNYDSLNLNKCAEISPKSSNNKHLRTVFYRAGLFVSDHRSSLILGLLAFSAIASVKILFTPQEDDLKTGYTPMGARSRHEMAMYEQFYSQNGTRKSIELDPGKELGPLSIMVFVLAKDNGTMLREVQLNETIQLLDHLSTEFPLNGQSFAQFCSDFCHFNQPIRQFANAFLMHRRYSSVNSSTDDLELESVVQANLSFPFALIFGRTFDLSPHFFGVEFLAKDGDDLKNAPLTSNIAFLKLVVLHFRADKLAANVSKSDIVNWERRIADFLHRDFQSSSIRPLAVTITFMADEIVRTGMTLFPYISVGFATMLVFSVSTVFLSAFYFDQWTRHKVWIAMVACICPLLATSSALGFLFWLGFRFGTILCVSPFLVIAIGVDDAYLMIQSWQRIAVDRRELRRMGTPSLKDTVRERIAEMLVDVGPSITITSATNALAFIIGIFTPTPEIQLFCAGNATAIFVDYLYQIFLFTPILAVVGAREMVEQEIEEDTPADKGGAIDGIRDGFRNILDRFMRNYCRWISSGFTALVLIIALVFYWVLAIRGTLQVMPNITPKKLFLADSLVNEENAIRDKYILPNYTAISVFVSKANGLQNETMGRVRQLVDEFESLANNLGSEFTHFWLRDYDKFMESIVEESGDEIIAETAVLFRRETMEPFLNWPEYKHWNAFLRFDTDSQLDRFFVITAFHGPELVEWNSRERQLRVWRGITDKYPDLGAFVWVDEAQFLDQIETLVPATIQSSIATLLCMTLVCLAFMSNVFTVVIATLSTVSICIGVFGFLTFWNIQLDPISMATTIMSIGFSVDFPAHIAYHYYRCGQESTTSQRRLLPRERVHEALVSIAFPLLQCGFSTILFVLSLLFVDTYMSEVFVKTMTLVVSLGLLHGLFVVPTLLCALSNLKDSARHLTNKVRVNKARKISSENTFKTRIDDTKMGKGTAAG